MSLWPEDPTAPPPPSFLSDPEYMERLREAQRMKPDEVLPEIAGGALIPGHVFTLTRKRGA